MYILGYRKFTGKQGQPLCVLSVVSDYSARQVEFGACGQQAQDIFVPSDQHSLIVPSCLGQEVNISYRVENGRAYVDHVEIG